VSSNTLNSPQYGHLVVGEAFGSGEEVWIAKKRVDSMNLTGVWFNYTSRMKSGKSACKWYEKVKTLTNKDLKP